MKHVLQSATLLFVTFYRHVTHSDLAVSTLRLPTFFQHECTFAAPKPLLARTMDRRVSWHTLHD